MRWNKRQSVERPEYPKLVSIAPVTESAEVLLRLLLASDPRAELVDGGAHGRYARVHNKSAEKAAKMYPEKS